MHYRDLTVWQKSMELVTMLYAVTKHFPREELFGLVSQIRRASVSIPSNIAEGSRRRGADGKHLLTIAYASGAELETQIEIARNLKYLTEENFQKLNTQLEEIMKMLNKMCSR